MSSAPPPAPDSHFPIHFPETAWAEISAARRGDNGEALQSLATAYWRPLYFFLRRSGHSHENAADGVQGFFEYILRTPFFNTIAREGAKFRSYLLTSLRHWLSRERTRETAQKRGGGIHHVPIEEMEAMEYAPDLDEPGDAELLYDRRWARDLVARSISLIRGEYAGRRAQSRLQPAPAIQRNRPPRNPRHRPHHRGRR
jgi:RNA polymerase sigma-70 factor (ECF subfamily)